VLAVSGADDDAPKLANERYAISKKLGEGGQAATFDAVDKLHGRAVVLKRFRVRGATSWKEVELAEREAHVLASIEHPNLPRYVEHFEERGELWLVTEKIEGESLAAKKQRRAGFRVADVERFLGDARDALAYLHGRAPPIVHRDIKPGNVIARPDGSFAIIDFGSVRDRLKPTGGSTVVGTFGYMAPEQFQGRAMPASDVYAVGVTALVMLTGQEPEELPHKGLAIDVAAALKGLPVRPELVRALERMTSPDPDARAPRVPELGARAAKKAEPAPRREGRRGEIDHAAAAMADLADELREKRNALKDELKARRRAAHDGRRAAREEQRSIRRDERRVRRLGRGLRFWDGRGLPPLLRALFTLGLAIAELGVRIATGLVVPAALTLLSIVFGAKLREAARGVSVAGKRAAIVVKYTRRVLQGRVPVRIAVGPAPSDPADDVQRAWGRARIDDAPPPRVRVGAPSSWSDDDEAEAESDAAAAERARRR
jgi:tRNA A-37 threonylcarbamoyl transferase component Bud32